MSDSSHIYIAIDLKSFYASVECVERECDPLTTNLVVADESRTEKTICLAVSPSLKAYGIPGRARLFEVVQKVKQINKERRSRIAGGVRDPHILRCEDGKTFYMVVTDMVSDNGWDSNRAMVLLKSTDLVN